MFHLLSNMKKGRIMDIITFSTQLIPENKKKPQILQKDILGKASSWGLIHANVSALCVSGLGQAMLETFQGIYTLESPPKEAASCSGWSNGTKSVFLRGLVPFNQLQQGWQCPILGEKEKRVTCS